MAASPWTKLDRYPPVLVRLLARKGRRLMTDEEILARAPQLSRKALTWISWQPTWDKVSVADMRVFFAACGIDIGSADTCRSLNRYLKQARFQHLMRSHNRREYLARLGTLLHE